RRPERQQALAMRLEVLLDRGCLGRRVRRALRPLEREPFRPAPVRRRQTREQHLDALELAARVGAEVLVPELRVAEGRVGGEVGADRRVVGVLRLDDLRREVELPEVVEVRRGGGRPCPRVLEVGVARGQIRPGRGEQVAPDPDEPRVREGRRELGDPEAVPRVLDDERPAERRVDRRDRSRAVLALPLEEAGRDELARAAAAEPVAHHGRALGRLQRPVRLPVRARECDRLPGRPRRERDHAERRRRRVELVDEVRDERQPEDGRRELVAERAAGARRAEDEERRREPRAVVEPELVEERVLGRLEEPYPRPSSHAAASTVLLAQPGLARRSHGARRRVWPEGRGPGGETAVSPHAPQSVSVVHSRSGLTIPGQWPAYSPFAESPSSGSVTWNDTTSRMRNRWTVLPEESVESMTVTSTTPSLSRLPGIQAVVV